MKRRIQLLDDDDTAVLMTHGEHWTATINFDKEQPMKEQAIKTCAKCGGKIQQVGDREGVSTVHFDENGKALPNGCPKGVLAVKAAAQQAQAATAKEKKAAERTSKVGGGARQPKIEGLNASSVVRWMGSKGFSFEDASALLTKRGVTLADSGIRWQLRAGKNRDGVYGRVDIPSITGDTAADLLKFKGKGSSIPVKVAKAIADRKPASGRKITLFDDEEPKKEVPKVDRLIEQLEASAGHAADVGFTTPAFADMKCRGCGVKATAKRAMHFEGFDVCAKCCDRLMKRRKTKTLVFSAEQFEAIHKTYSSDLLADKGRLRGFVVIAGKRYIASGTGSGGTGAPRADIKPLYLKAEWKSGPTWPYSKKPKVPGKFGGHITYFGITATCRGQEYVFGSPFDAITATTKPEAAKKAIREKTVAKKKTKGGVRATVNA